MSLIQCRADRYLYCPFIYDKEREVIMRYTFYNKEITAEGGEKNA